MNPKRNNMTPVQVAMSSMDEQHAAHIESLRNTINHIDSTIPFLKLSGDDKESQSELEGIESVPTPFPTTDPNQ